eukprot:365162-Chlamydomonas_euryale.AAC.17
MQIWLPPWSNMYPMCSNCTKWYEVFCQSSCVFAVCGDMTVQGCSTWPGRVKRLNARDGWTVIV